MPRQGFLEGLPVDVLGGVPLRLLLFLDAEGRRLITVGAADTFDADDIATLAERIGLPPTGSLQESITIDDYNQRFRAAGARLPAIASSARALTALGVLFSLLAFGAVLLLAQHFAR
jgi:hypothetical protein